ncbi:UBX domain-containing protein 2 [Elsinoe australis]|uniref:UBX domain-containing protein 2 n=1 Tax=Elsinoe australis TaxID=40998 RepID=A0A2P7Z0T1_9PEZI|nr:UBX domain-containing protein 2 [Elsinoe australis]
METAAPSPDATSLAYIEPATILLLIVTSFLLLLNIINSALDKFIYCGLIGQIFLGILYGQPGAKWLPLDLQVSVQTLGYLGLVLIVYEGGLSTSITTLKSNLWLSSLVAATGIGVPMGLSFILMSLLPISPLQAFSAGAALCATSLGTTFTVLSTSGLSDTKLGVILSSAAMIDDVVGLVMIQVIQNLSTATGGGFRATTVVRPVFVSIGLAIVVPALCKWAILPIRRAVSGWVQGSKVEERLRTRETAFVSHTLLLIGLSVGAYYAGTSILFAAYLAGAMVSWWDSVIASKAEPKSTIKGEAEEGKSPTGAAAQGPTRTARRRSSTASARPSSPAKLEMTGLAVYHHYYHPAINRILRPFFFASIGFSIPITQLFSGAIVWRGIVYTILMLLGKLVCGLWLVRFNTSLGISAAVKKLVPFAGNNAPKTEKSTFATASPATPDPSNTATVTVPPSPAKNTPGSPSIGADNPSPANQSSPRPTPNSSRKRKPTIPKPLSLYPSAILGSAMVARGEIGFLISSLAESQGVFAGGQAPQGGSSDLFLVVTWAILLCTIAGPVVVGLLVKRVKKLQIEERGRGSGRGDPLGVWGVI